VSEDERSELPAALLLDLDGTLVDSEPLHRAAYTAFFADRGWPDADLTLFTGRRAQDVFASTPGPWSGQDPLELAAAVVACTPPGEAPRPVAGARRLIETAAARGVPVAVVTSADRPWAEQVLDGTLGVLGHVDVMVTARDVAHGKPDPAGFSLACSRLGVPPRTCVAVEDSPAGVAAAVAAGVHDVVGLATTHSGEELVRVGAIAVYPDLDAVAAWLHLTR
jgi:sugar-phosphatase